MRDPEYTGKRDVRDQDIPWSESRKRNYQQRETDFLWRKSI